MAQSFGSKTLAWILKVIRFKKIVEFQVNNGDTVYIGVLPNGVEINTGYILSVDIN